MKFGLLMCAVEKHANSRVIAIVIVRRPHALSSKIKGFVQARHWLRDPK